MTLPDFNSVAIELDPQQPSGSWAAVDGAGNIVAVYTRESGTAHYKQMGTARKIKCSPEIYALIQGYTGTQDTTQKVEPR